MTSLSYARRLIEADLPIRDLSLLKGKSSGYHDVDVKMAGLWWSRKPQAQSRGIWLALLLPDPTSGKVDAGMLEGLRSIAQKYGFLSNAGAESRLAFAADLLQICIAVSMPTAILRSSTAALLTDLIDHLGLRSQVALDPFSAVGLIPLKRKG